MRTSVLSLLVTLLVGCEGASINTFLDIGDISLHTVVGDGNTMTDGSPDTTAGSAGSVGGTDGTNQLRSLDTGPSPADPELWKEYELVFAVEYGYGATNTVSPAAPISLSVLDPHGNPWMGVMRNGQLTVAWLPGEAARGFYSWQVESSLGTSHSNWGMFDGGFGIYTDIVVRVWANGVLVSEESTEDYFGLREGGRLPGEYTY